jgi:hypothetical protein|tara:strand:+ start:368 stop:646 length:279 start_codon:yes stop_codon:yes gene_type:complete
MQIKFDYYDIQKAVQLLIKERLGISLDLEDLSPHDYPSIEYQERVFVYKKHKNGKEVKDENGLREIDWDKSKYVTKHIEFDDSADITFYVGE